MGPKPKIKRRSIEEIRQITKEALLRAYENKIEFTYNEIEKAALAGDWLCKIPAYDISNYLKDFKKYFTDLGFSVSYDDEYCCFYIGWRNEK